MPELKALEPGMASIPATFPDGLSNTMWLTTKWIVCGDGGSRFASAVNSKTAAFYGQNHATKKANPGHAGVTFQLNPGPQNCLCTPLMAQSYSITGISVGMADGSVRYIHANISPETWNRAVQPNDGQPLGADWE